SLIDIGVEINGKYKLPAFIGESGSKEVIKSLKIAQGHLAYSSPYVKDQYYNLNNKAVNICHVVFGKKRSRRIEAE
ncbi:41690_t:CDS:2, partial [Gigaspora margarita]